jgi:hypothetical protein
MTITRDVKIVPRAAGVLHTTFFLRSNKKTRKKQRSTTVQSCASCVKNAMNTHFLHDRRQTVDRCVQ